MRAKPKVSAGAEYIEDDILKTMHTHIDILVYKCK